MKLNFSTMTRGIGFRCACDYSRKRPHLVGSPRSQISENQRVKATMDTRNITTFSRRRLVVLIGTVTLAVVLTACGNTGSSDEENAGPAADSPTATFTAETSSTSTPAVASPAESVVDQGAATATSTQKVAGSTATSTPEPTPEPEIGPDGLYVDVQVTEEGTKFLIPWQRIFSGGVPRDGIPSIDAPKFADNSDWNDLGYNENGLVIGVEVEGTRRAYPFQVIVWHELVNDTINGKPILISYCPLCGTAIAFERSVNGQEFEFGVSGLLYNSDLLMYDRNTEALWSQINGTAVVGELSGARLEFYPSEIMTWGDWRNTYPDSEVLTTDTGAARDYSRDPYENYYFDERLLFPVNRTSDIYDALPAKIDVTGIEVDGPAYGAFVSRDVRNAGIVNETVGATPVVVFANPSAGENIVVFERQIDGQELHFEFAEGGLRDTESGSFWSYDGLAMDGPWAGNQLVEIVPVKGFWFGWVAFHPETSLWQLDDE